MEVNVLMTSAGRRVPLTRAFKKAIAEMDGVTGKVISIDMDPLSAGLYVSDDYYLVPHSTSEEYIPTILDICQNEKITMVVPTTDGELEILSEHREKFSAIGSPVIVSSPEVIKICNDKYNTYLWSLEKGIPFPKSWLKEEIEEKLASGEKIKYPLFIKPRDGRGSIHSYVINNEKELIAFLNYVPNPIIQELLDGKEYTIDVLSDLKGKVISVVPRERITAAAGVSQKGRTVKDGSLIHLAKKIAETMGLIGPTNIQCRATSDGAKYFEVNPRFAGGVPLTLAAGVDFPSLLIKMVLGEEVTPIIGQFTHNLVMLRYDESLFIDESRRNLIV